MARAVLVALAASAAASTVSTGCSVDGTGLDVIAVSASLSNHQKVALVILGGATWGDATMDFTDDTGVTRSVPVGFAGPSGGLLMDVHVSQDDLLFDSSETAELQIPDGGVPVDDLFGLYRGGSGSIALGLGYCDMQLGNEAAVRLVISGACAGMGMARAENWLTMSTDGDVTEPAAE